MITMSVLFYCVFVINILSIYYNLPLSVPHYVGIKVQSSLCHILSGIKYHNTDVNPPHSSTNNPSREISE
jgi:hypothetical protein